MGGIELRVYFGRFARNEPIAKPTPQKLQEVPMVQAHGLLKRLKSGSLAFLFVLIQASLALTPFINTAKVSAATPTEECSPLTFLVKYQTNESTGTFIGTVADDGGQDVITFTNIQLKEEDGKKEIIGFDWSSTVAVDKVVVVAANKTATQSGNELTSGTYGDDFTGESGFNENKGVSHVTFCYDPEPASITIVKNAVPDDEQDFAFTSTLSGQESFSLDNDESDDTLLRQKEFSGLSAGTYTFTELETSGWYLSDITCTQGSTNDQSIENRSVSITVAAGENVTCTFENRPVEPETGSITIIKDAQPNSTQDFEFTAEADRRGGTEILDDEDEADEDGENENSFTLPDQTTGTTWTITESETDGWELDDIVCTGDTDSTVTTDVESRKVSVTIAANEAVICTFINKPSQTEPETGNLQVLKQVDEGGEEGFQSVGAETDFKWFLDDDTTERDMGATVNDLEPDTYEVTENIDEMTDYNFVGWFLGQGSCEEVDGTSHPVEVTVAEGETTVVTLCNQVKEDKKVELCHATGADKYVYIEISPAGAFNGHLDESLGGGATQGNHQEGEDIIEPFTYKGQLYSQNWDTEGQATFNNDCEVPEEEDKEAKVKVTKFDDLNRNGEWDEGEPTLSGWAMTLQGEAQAEQPTICDIIPTFPGCDGNGIPELCGYPFPPCETGINAQFILPCGEFPFPPCVEDYQYSETQTTEGDGSTTFENVKPGVTHYLSETQKEGWTWSNTYCEYGYESEGREISENNYAVYPASGETVECYVGNYRDDMSHVLDKANDTPIAENGDVVTYTLTYTVPEDSGTAFDVCVSDLLPEGFTFNGNWSTNDPDVTENVEDASEDCGEAGGPSYGNEGPAEWYLGDVYPGTTIVMTYEVVVSEEVTPGTYTNIAFASAYECNRSLEQECDREDTPFVYSDVTLLAGGRGGQVLGVSTTRKVLVDTGDSRAMLITIVAAVLLGTTFIATRKKINV